MADSLQEPDAYTQALNELTKLQRELVTEIHKEPLDSDAIFRIHPRRVRAHRAIFRAGERRLSDSAINRDITNAELGVYNESRTGREKPLRPFPLL